MTDYEKVILYYIKAIVNLLFVIANMNVGNSPYGNLEKAHELIDYAQNYESKL